MFLQVLLCLLPTSCLVIYFLSLLCVRNYFSLMSWDCGLRLIHKKKKNSKPVETRYANVYNLLDNLIFGLTLKIQFAIAFMCSNDSLILLHTRSPMNYWFCVHVFGLYRKQDRVDVLGLWIENDSLKKKKKIKTRRNMSVV